MPRPVLWGQTGRDNPAHFVLKGQLTIAERFSWAIVSRPGLGESPGTDDIALGFTSYRAILQFVNYPGYGQANKSKWTVISYRALNNLTIQLSNRFINKTFDG